MNCLYFVTAAFFALISSAYGQQSISIDPQHLIAVVEAQRNSLSASQARLQAALDTLLDENQKLKARIEELEKAKLEKKD
jgi:cell division protein FtsB